MTDYIVVASTSDISEQQPLVVIKNGYRIAIYRIGEKLYAIEDICPHMGAFLSNGYCEGSRAVCPWHNWQFDLESGECVTNDNGLTVQTFPIKEVDNQILLAMETDSAEDDDWPEGW